MDSIPSDVINSNTLQESSFDCSICLDSKLLSNFISMECCNKTICKDCLKLQLESFHSFCPICNGSLYPFSNSLIQFAESFNFNLKNIIPNSNLLDNTPFICPTCHSQFQVNLTDISSDPSVIISPCCKIQLCVYCQEPMHLNKKFICAGMIKYIHKDIIQWVKEINEEIHEIELVLDQNSKNNKDNAFLDIDNKNQDQLKDLYNKRRFRFCPECMAPMLKESGCDNVQCESCRVKLCFVCTAPREPIISHGSNVYHRSACKYYDQEAMKNITREYNSLCAACVKKGELCDLPSTWEEYQQQVKATYGDIFFAKEFEFNWKIL